MAARATFDVRKEPFRMIAFGAGVQSVALLYAWLFDSIYMPQQDGWTDFEGFFDGQRPDVVLFADTKAEPSDVYAAVEDARVLCEKVGVRFETVTAGDLANPPKASTGTQGILTPVYTVKLYTDEDGPAGEEGQLKRQCTQRYKIEPMMKRAAELAGDRPIEVTMGISLDEAHRMKRRDSGDRVQNRYPLIMQDALGMMSRHDCVNLLNDLGVSAGKSACYFCPYKADARWIEMYRNDSELFAKTVEYDRWVRDQRPGYKCYVHRSRRPLEDVVSELVAANDLQTGLFPIDLDTAASGGCEEGYCEG